MPRVSLADAAQGFADQLTETVRASVDATCADFVAVAADNRVAVRQSPREGIVLTSDGHGIATLTASYWFAWDSEGEFLAVQESAFKVYAGEAAAGEPLFRYEFNRGSTDDIPNAHLHVHGQRDALAYVLTRAGERTPRGKRRARLAARGQAPTMADLHFPVGGDRFRPALEDVLQTLVEELGVDCVEGWRNALADGRRRWRELQAAAVVRDSPGVAAQVLARLGYEVSPPKSGPATGQPGRLTEL